MHDVRSRESSIKYLVRQLEEDQTSKPDDKETIAQLMKNVHEGDHIMVYVYHITAYDRDLLHGIRRVIHTILDDMKLFDVQVSGTRQHIKIDDNDHYDGEVDVTITRRQQEGDITYK